MRPALQQLLLQLVIRLLIPQFFSTACSYSVRPRLTASEPAVSLPHALAVVPTNCQSINSSQTCVACPEEARVQAQCSGLPLLRTRVNSLRLRSASFEALRLEN